MRSWRYIEEDGVSAGFGLAADELLLQQAARQGVTTLRLYTYRSHAALVGRFQNIEAEVRIEECERAGAQINRRITGGGAIVMGEGQLGLALALSPQELSDRPIPALVFERYSRSIIEGLRSLGVAAAFRPKNDVEVQGRKIAGLGICLDEEGALLFHCSLLVDLDMPLMLRLLRLGPEKISDKDIATFEERLTTVKREAGPEITVDEVRRAVKAAFEREPGVRLEPLAFSGDELEAIERLEKERYLTPEWVFEHAAPADLTGSCVVKTPAGLLRVYVSLAGEVLKNVVITGDFFGDERTLRDLEARLKWQQATPDAVAKAVEEAWGPPDAPPVWDLPPSALADAIMVSIAGAKAASPES